MISPCLHRVCLRGCLYDAVVSSSIDGEQFYGDQEFLGNPDQQGSFDKGKYSMGKSLLSYSP
jgi:hypothetical protein